MNLWQKITYNLLKGLSQAIGRLPRWMLYGGFARFIYFLLYRVVGYRKKVVATNLKNAFPEKNRDECKDIERKFYRHLANLFVDTFALSSMSANEVRQRITFPDLKQQEALMQGKNWIAAMAHYGSWELMMSYALQSDHRLLAVYRPLHSAMFDRYYSHVRSRFGAIPVAMNDILRSTVQANRSEATPIVIGLICDQTPPRREIKQWYSFLNQETPFFTGMEKMATKFGMPVYFTHVRRTTSNCYEITFEQLYDGHESVVKQELTQRYITRLEEMIHQQPELWMWSHRRWKYKQPAQNQ